MARVSKSGVEHQGYPSDKRVLDQAALEKERDRLNERRIKLNKREQAIKESWEAIDKKRAEQEKARLELAADRKQLEADRKALHNDRLQFAYDRAIDAEDPQEIEQLTLLPMTDNIPIELHRIRRLLRDLAAFDPIATAEIQAKLLDGIERLTSQGRELLERKQAVRQLWSHREAS